MSEAKKIKLSADFTERGRFDDEITLKFDDGKELFVAKSFLCMASPVFDAMLTRDFKEKENKTIKMVGKKYHIFLQFLKCIHPAGMDPVTQLTMLKVIPLAEEYQHDALIMRCKELMEKTLNDVDTEHKLYSEKNSTKWKSINCVYWMLLILRLSSKLNYDALTQLAIEYLGKCSHVFYCGRKWYTGCLLPDKANEQKSQVLKLYQSLPETLKNQVLLQRLDNIGPD